MDFELNETQQAAADLASQIISEKATHERMKAIESAAEPSGPFDEDLWGELSSAGLLGIGIAEEYGGAGLDFLAVASVLEPLGRTAAYVPAYESMVLAAEVISVFGTEDQKQRWLPGLADGSIIGTAALSEQFGGYVTAPGATPSTVAVKHGSEYKLTGTKACVPAGLVATLVIVPALVDGRLSLFVIHSDASALETFRQDGASRPEAMIELEGAVVAEHDVLGGIEIDATQALDFLTQRAITGLCIIEAGAVASALKLAADYTTTREQFGKAIASFQAVGQRLADAYVDAEAISLTAWQAAWRLSVGLPSASEVAMAKYWAAEGGQRVVHACVHVHGGVGVDRDYPLHRFFLLTRQIELTLGGANESLRHLGSIIATAAVG